MDFKLTDRQREFAEKNHYVLENFMEFRHLPKEEFYDVVVFRFLRAVKEYDEREDLKAYSFATIAKTICVRLCPAIMRIRNVKGADCIKADFRAEENNHCEH